MFIYCRSHETSETDMEISKEEKTEKQAKEAEETTMQIDPVPAENQYENISDAEDPIPSTLPPVNPQQLQQEGSDKNNISSGNINTNNNINTIVTNQCQVGDQACISLEPGQQASGAMLQIPQNMQYPTMDFVDFMAEFNNNASKPFPEMSGDDVAYQLDELDSTLNATNTSNPNNKYDSSSNSIDLLIQAAHLTDVLPSLDTQDPATNHLPCPAPSNQPVFPSLHTHDPAINHLPCPPPPTKQPVVPSLHPQQPTTNHLPCPAPSNQPINQMLTTPATAHRSIEKATASTATNSAEKRQKKSKKIKNYPCPSPATSQPPPSSPVPPFLAQPPSTSKQANRKRKVKVAEQSALPQAYQHKIASQINDMRQNKKFKFPDYRLEDGTSCFTCMLCKQGTPKIAPYCFTLPECFHKVCAYCLFRRVVYSKTNDIHLCCNKFKPSSFTQVKYWEGHEKTRMMITDILNKIKPLGFKRLFVNKKFQGAITTVPEEFGPETKEYKLIKKIFKINHIEAWWEHYNKTANYS